MRSFYWTQLTRINELIIFNNEVDDILSHKIKNKIHKTNLKLFYFNLFKHNDLEHCAIIRRQYFLSKIILKKMFISMKGLKCFFSCSLEL